MHRFIIDDNIENIDKFNIYGDDVNHIKNVLRLNRNDEIVVYDGSDYEYTCKIVDFDRDCVNVQKISSKINETESKLTINLFQSIPKSDKMELVIQKATELGVKKIIPIITERTIVRFKDIKDIENKLKRWRRIALEASKQSRRSKVPEIMNPIDFKKSLDLIYASDLSIIPFEKEKKNGLKDLIRGKEISKVNVFIGPEGGFTQEEIELAKSIGVKPITLGSRILRSETAGFVTVSILMYEIGDIGQ